MRYKLLGRSGLRVSELCLGTMTFGEEWGWGAGKEESFQMYKKFIDAGGNFIDTANRYTEGTSEKFLGEFIGSERPNIVLATKYTLFEDKRYLNRSGNHRKNMVQSLENSLKRLKTDYIDLYYLHVWDSTTPEDEILRALDDMVRAGKILYIGISDTPAWIVSRCNTLAELMGWSRFISLQVEYSLIERTPERDLIPMAEHMGLALAGWAPIAGGVLSGKYLEGETGRVKEGSPRLNERAVKIAKKTAEIAKSKNCTPTQVAVRWVMQKNRINVPIIGARKLSQLEDSLTSADIELNENEMKELNEVSGIELGFPHDFIRSAGPQNVMYGDQKKFFDFQS
ncbi:MAG TPA: aldo/keto reductase [Leptospiraceae bacterium]|nr:aldo/keto reductase [Leptospiraceae bacterium]HMY68089.1 aldo/keto reductase [Leptospiraceae bacterium]HNF13259.1 aldo/keto reductase [Leptospiraceae bacterium]HNF25508.1 aldo/keto reductase [Leptospiraceae bacterium]HNI95971.1 aldo/keto reductase [Leptospiraceae bacterium]